MHYGIMMISVGLGIEIDTLFLGTDQIVSIPSSIEKHLIIRYQMLIPKGLLSSTLVSQLVEHIY